MPRGKKNPVTEMPIVEDFPIQHEPGSHDGIFDNVIPIDREKPIAEPDRRNWGEIDSILSDVVSFGGN